jgi:hypothetical protein
LVNGLSRKISKLPEDLKLNVTLNQTLLNEVDLTVKLKSSVSLLSIEVEHALLKTKGHNTCNTQKKHWNWKESLKHLQLYQAW